MVAISEQNEYYNEKVEESETDDTYDDSDDDSEEDPCFDILEDTRSTFSKLSIKKKSKSGIQKEMVEEMEGDPELIVPDLDEKDQKSFETVQKIIEVGQIDKLKVDQCKVYLRKHGLRLTGNKDTLIGRIREHLDIANGGGEKKYPASSFIVNCKGDACMGDVVMFEQNVYEMFSIASRSATGPPCGTRVVAGRIIKESYGAAKQQHTFTIEVLWSKGEKPLPSLHPLLIKGRNLYKLRTMRQRWQDEGERQKILLEKHTRGSVARSDRESRIQEKEMRKALKANRVSRTETCNLKMEAQKILPSILGRHPSEKQNTQTTLPINLGKLVNQQENVHQNECRYSKTWNANTSNPSEAHCRKVTTFFSNANMPSERVHCERQPFAVLNHRKPRGYEQGIISSDPFRGLQAREDNTGFNHMKSPLRSHGHSQGRTSSNLRSSSPFRRQNNNEQKQLCKYYPQGRCYYGDQCKFVHEYNREENRSYGQRRSERWPSDLGYY